MRKDVLVIGAGLTGLSCSLKLEKAGADCLLAEREIRTGGIASSFIKDGFTFDYSGHLLHLRWPETSKFILSFLKENAGEISRNSSIFLKDRLIKYPFQINLYNLPQKIKNECVNGFLKARLENEAVKESFFKPWCLKTFGSGICRHFMFPYNEKLWRYPLEKMTLDWMGAFVPVPKTAEVLYGAYRGEVKNTGYNYDFVYPLRGGIGTLPSAMASKVRNLSLDSELLSLDLKKKTAKIKNLGPVKYKKLVSTIPLKSLINRLEKAPDRIKTANEKLVHNQIYVLNLGIKGKGPDSHWIYFPEKKYPFYRTGFYSNFSPTSAPKGCFSAYVEISSLPGEFINLEKTGGQIVKKLLDSGFIKDRTYIMTSMWLKIPCAYVIYDSARKKTVSFLSAYLRENGVETAGRYGSWKYSFMEESVKEGLETAQKIVSGG